MRVLIIDDHAVVRDGIKRIFEERGRAVELGEAADDRGALRLVHEQEWDLIILDLSLGERGGLLLLKDLKTLRPRLPVLILTMHDAEQYALRAFRAGAAGYITKDSPREELLKAVDKVLMGGRYVSPNLADRLLGSIARPTDSPLHASLSDREFEVLRLIGSGKTVGEIAETLGLSKKTISTYRARILEKMHMRTNAELTSYAVQHRLVG